MHTGGGKAVRTNCAIELVTEPYALVTVTKYGPARADCTLVKVSAALVLPSRELLLKYHW